MKKLLFIAFAATAIITACSQDEIVEQSTPKAIEFSEAFIDKTIGARSVDPSYTLDGAGETNKLDAFDVYGFNNNHTSMLFDATVVSGGDKNWTYSPARYWRKGIYSFVALAPSGNSNISVTKEENLGPETDSPEKLIKAITFKNATGAHDLLYAKATVDNSNKINTKTVDFTFRHLLSKIKFTVTNGFQSEQNTTIEVTNICINAVSEGTYNTQTSTWSPCTVRNDYNFGNVKPLEGTATADSDFMRLFIPQKDGTYNISFRVKSTFNDITTTYTHVYENVTLANFEPGHSYNIKITIDSNNVNPDGILEEIKFNVVAIEGWISDESTDVPFDPSVI